MFFLVFRCLIIEMKEVTLPYPIINEIHAKRVLRENRTFTQLIIKCTVFYRT